MLTVEAAAVIRLLPEDVRGRDVLLASEVAGSSMSYDRGIKARLYARHGIREFWVVDAASRVSWVHRRPQADGQWGSIEQVPPGSPVSPEGISDLAVTMAELD